MTINETNKVHDYPPMNNNLVLNAMPSKSDFTESNHFNFQEWTLLVTTYLNL